MPISAVTSVTFRHIPPPNLVQVNQADHLGKSLMNTDPVKICASM